MIISQINFPYVFLNLYEHIRTLEGGDTNFHYKPIENDARA
nr:MAG TPA: hypothetical protein [Caudoviricetes sp.]